MGGIAKIFAPNDPELVQKTLARLSEQDSWNDVFSTKLIELLDKIDQIKSEIRQHLRAADKRIQRAESVTQAESTLVEKAAQFGDSSRRLELAHAAEQRAVSFAVEAKQEIVKTSAALEEARQLVMNAKLAEQQAIRLANDAQLQSEKASGALEGARQMAEEARSFAQDANKTLHEAQQAEYSAKRLSRGTVRYAALAVSLSWIAMAWAGWFTLGTKSVLWIPVVLSVVFAACAEFVVWRTRNDT